MGKIFHDQRSLQDPDLHRIAVKARQDQLPMQLACGLERHQLTEAPTAHL
jgi:hypothetical protein